MQGRRIPNKNREGGFPDDCHPGDYWLGEDGQTWWAYCPRGGIGCLANHEVVEHEDGTITVTPSILLVGQWHGYLEGGVWREC